MAGLLSGIRRGGAIVVAVAVVGAAMVLQGATPAGSVSPPARTFGFVGAGVTQTYVVPDGVHTVQATLFGGGGGFGGGVDSGGEAWDLGSPGGRGASVGVSLPVTPGETLTVTVGGRGANANTSNIGGTGGDGGALSSISRAGTPLAVAGGGGGGGGAGYVGETISGDGAGGDSGHDGQTPSESLAGSGGKPGPSQAGGAAGTCTYGCATPATPGGAGSGTTGGPGGSGCIDSATGSYGAGGGDGGQGVLGGGGGGGGGCTQNIWGLGGGGAGGTSSLYGHPGTVIDGVNDGDGRVILAPAGTFAFVGAGVPQSYLVPQGVSLIEVSLSGAQGGAGGVCSDGEGRGGAGGRGAQIVLAPLPVTEGEILTIVVGGQGRAGAPVTMTDGDDSWCLPGGGGGGGLTSISRGATPMAIAGGGGGGGGGGVGLIEKTAGGRGGDSGHDGYSSSGTGSGYGGKTGPTQTGGDPGMCNGPIFGCAKVGGNGVGTTGGGGGRGQIDSEAGGCSPSGAYGGDGGQGVLGGGGGGGGGCESDYAGAGGGGAGGTSDLYGNLGFLTEGAHEGDGELIITPIGAPPGNEGPPGSEAPGQPPLEDGHTTAPLAVLVPPRFTG